MIRLDLVCSRVLDAIARRLAQRGCTVLITSQEPGPLITVCDLIHLVPHGRFTRMFERGAMDGLERTLFAELNGRTGSVVSKWGGR